LADFLENRACPTPKYPGTAAGSEPVREGPRAAPGDKHTDTLPSIEEQFRQLELQAAEHHDAWLRAKAEGENIRRRAQEDIAKAHKFAVEKFAGELLAVKDSLEAALAVPEQTVESFKSGVELTLKQLVSAFEKNALTEVNPAGEKFDPYKHQAIGMIDSEQEANTVVTVLQKGYLIAERVLRPALVMVAKPKS
jgi:molecular chaperone GrpE